MTNRIESREVPIAIFGLGYVGLPLAVLFVQAGFRVLGYDINEAYIARLRQGRSSILDVSDAELKACMESGRFQVTSDIQELQDSGIYIICVPTPLSKSRQPDMSCIEGALEALVTIWGPDKMAILESTTYPGTTDEILLPALSCHGLKLDEDFLLAFSPERVDPGNAMPLSRIPKVVGGVSPASTEAAAALYSTVFDTVHPVSSAKAAELTKLLENTFRNVNIALVNEISQICDTIGVNVWETIDAASTKPFGYMPFYPGPGIGGHCIPLDPQYLVYKARLHGYEPRLVALADQINFERPRYIVEQAMDCLNWQGKSLRGANVLVLGVAYKGDVPDLRESPALPIIEALQEKGGRVSYCDPHIPKVRLENGNSLEAVPFSVVELEKADLLVLLTAHKAFDYECLCKFRNKLLDTRNALGSRGLPAANALCSLEVAAV